jgi:Raf kinase inhibitor-like YbhB/YbcL family protein
MHLRSPAFDNEQEIPSRYTHDGQDISPPLEWDDVPPGTRSLALLVEDPDAPDPAHPLRTWTHWVVVDLPPESHGLPEGARVGAPAVTGLNDWDKAAYGGPAPPVGRHHYIFKLYALDRRLDLEAPTKYDLKRALANDVVLAEAKLVGTYEHHDAA